MKTIDYYNNNAQAFHDRTIHADLSQCYHKLLKYLPPQAHILDAGCGSGRDSKYFLNQGYHVTAFDASHAMVRLASQTTDLKVLHLRFEDIDFKTQFDAVWAQASLLHIPYDMTRTIYQKIHRALKPNGIFFASYKYGTSFMPTPERNFWNMTESTILPYLEGLFHPLEIWKEPDTRSTLSPSKNKAWLNFIAKSLPSHNPFPHKIFHVQKTIGYERSQKTNKT